MVSVCRQRNGGHRCQCGAGRRDAGQVMYIPWNWCCSVARVVSVTHESFVVAAVISVVRVSVMVDAVVKVVLTKELLVTVVCVSPPRFLL